MMYNNSTLSTLRACWAGGLALIMMLNLDQFFYANGWGPEPKLVAVSVFLINLALFGGRVVSSRQMKGAVVWWLAGYVVLSMIWTVFSKDWSSAIYGFNFVVSTALYVLGAYLMLKGGAHSSTFWRVTLWLALIASVLSIVFESLFPQSSLFTSAGLGIKGRSAGFFMNPNSAGSAVVVILGCILIRESRWGNLIATLIAFPGVLLTYSRGGIAAWEILVVLAAIQGRFPRYTIPVLLSIAAAAATVLTVDDVIAKLNPASQNSLDRIEWILGQGEMNGHAASDRQWITGYAWNEFLASPLYGHGLGYMWIWGAEIGSHNMILRHLTEYGIVGFFIFPMFLVCGIWSSDQRHSSKMRWLVAVIMLMMSFFSHNLLDQGRFIFSWLIFCLAPSAVLLPSIQTIREFPNSNRVAIH